MPLNNDDIRALQAPFALQDHGAREGGGGKVFAYLTEEAIAARLDNVDPAWDFRIVKVERIGIDQVVATGELSVKGSTRSGVGMQLIEYGMKPDKNDKSPNPVKVKFEAGEGEKGAATDAFKRAARLFGVGRYLLDAPQTREEFPGWLVEYQQRQNAPTPTPTLSIAPASPTPITASANGKPAQAHAEPVPGTTAIGPLTSNSKDWAVVKRDTLADCYQGNEDHQKTSLSNGLRDGWLTEAMTVSGAIMAIRVHRREIDTLKLVFPRVKTTYTQPTADDRFKAFVADAYRLLGAGKITSIENEDEVVAQVQLDLLGELT